MSRQVVRLEKLARMKYGKMPPKEILSEDGFPVFSGYRITGFSKEYLYEDPRVIIVARGVGGTGDVKMSPPKCWITNLVIVLEHNEEIVDKTFLFYCLSHEPLKEKLNTGAAQAQITIDSLSSYQITVPDLHSQRRIGTILDAYSSLINNNIRRINLLEEAARQVYQEWFVRLRFPGYEHTAITNGVPRGWQGKTLGEVCFDVRDSVSPNGLQPDTPYIGLEHMPRRSITLAEWGNAEQVTSTKLRFASGDIIFGKIRPYFHKVGIALVDGVSSSDAIIIRPERQNLHALVLMTVSSDPFVASTSQSMREGSKMPRADWKQMKQYPMAVPPSVLLQSFNDTIEPIIAQLKNLVFQNQKLRAARDLLLPKLMSGEISV